MEQRVAEYYSRLPPKNLMAFNATKKVAKKVAEKLGEPAFFPQQIKTLAFFLGFYGTSPAEPGFTGTTGITVEQYQKIKRKLTSKRKVVCSELGIKITPAKPPYSKWAVSRTDLEIVFKELSGVDGLHYSPERLEDALKNI